MAHCPSGRAGGRRSGRISLYARNAPGWRGVACAPLLYMPPMPTAGRQDSINTVSEQNGTVLPINLGVGQRCGTDPGDAGLFPSIAQHTSQQSVARRLPSHSSHGACEGAMPCDAGTCVPPWGRRGCKRGEERGAARGSTEARRCGACQGALSRAALPRAAWAAARRGAAQVPSDGHMRRHRAAARPIAACRAERRGCFAGKP